MERGLWWLGFATCQLPFFIAVALGLASPWAGVAAGAATSVVCGTLWYRRTEDPRFLGGIALGLFFAVMGGSLTVPSLRMLTGALPTYRLGEGQPLGGGTPMAVEVYVIEGGAPRTDLTTMGDVFQTRGEAGTFYLYSVVAPVVPPAWKESEPVPAWVICEVALDSDDEHAKAKAECLGKLGRDEIYENEEFDTDLPNEPMVQQAMTQHGLTQAPNAPIFILHEVENGLPGVLAPLMFMLFTLAMLSSAVKNHLEKREPSAELPEA